ncbi:AGE family epimerase/isomerase [Adhaeribacter aquaticus]|uniref:AGE family epimerase/isomerase n=1 Tax=Adhaeribacter aquaticus TaxID=299567 RepID=UPI0004189D4B|nr:AGE family epimerase/isomerase [Adhaeribacter aquaticus]
MNNSLNTEFLDDIKQFRQEAEEELNRILLFWRKYAVDEVNGGFVGRLDNNNQVDKSAAKGSILNARILWGFSAGYQHTKNPEDLCLAQRAFTYFEDYFLDKEYGGVFWSVSAEGNPENTRKQIYSLAFAIYGLSEFYKATKNNNALLYCQNLFEWIEKYSYDPVQGGYLEAFSQEGDLLEDLRLSPKDRNALKTTNTHLHVLEAYTNLYRVWPDSKLAKQLTNLIRVFLHTIIDGDQGHLKLFFTSDWVSTADLISFGHDIEASWLLVEAAESLGNTALLMEVKVVAAKLAAATALQVQPDGSLYHEFNANLNHYDKHREWWVSAEAMIGFMNAYNITKEIVFFEKAWNSWSFIQKHLLDYEKGEWFWGVYDDYSTMLKEDKIGFWKGPYHNTRACLNIFSRCTSLLEV